MERDELIQNLDAELTRAVKAMKAISPDSSGYRDLLGVLRELFWLRADIEGPGLEPKGIVLNQEPAPVDMAEQFKTEKEDYADTFQPEPVGEPEPVVADAVEITYEDLRAAVKEKAASGKPMQPVIEKYVPDGKPIKLSSVPKARYAELMEELNNAG